MRRPRTLLPLPLPPFSWSLIDQASAEREAAKVKQEGTQAYAKADVVVALPEWDNAAVRPVAQGALRALKYLLEAQKDLPGEIFFCVLVEWLLITGLRTF